MTTSQTTRSGVALSMRSMASVPDEAASTSNPRISSARSTILRTERLSSTTSTRAMRYGLSGGGGMAAAARPSSISDATLMRS